MSALLPPSDLLCPTSSTAPPAPTAAAAPSSSAPSDCAGCQQAPSAQMRPSTCLRTASDWPESCSSGASKCWHHLIEIDNLSTTDRSAEVHGRETKRASRRARPAVHARPRQSSRGAGGGGGGAKSQGTRQATGQRRRARRFTPLSTSPRCLRRCAHHFSEFAKARGALKVPPGAWLFIAWRKRRRAPQRQRAGDRRQAARVRRRRCG